ncbi:TonB-dependent receptor [Novosphingobium organovorum]|uniref:TonB-dependent receptor n=1 Tax=Novosphingobium organovorum TaxID=2930092 RepID=UPI0022833FA1|nr:TonB-dependent receptor [Novosphingobium organovorum]
MANTLRLLIGASTLGVFSLPVPLHAQTEGSTGQDQPQSADTAKPIATFTPSEIIVTARRQAENLQDVPETVTAVSGDAIQKLNLTQSQDLSSVVTGLTLNQGSVTSGRSPAPALRGVSYDAGVTPSPTVDIYVNEVPSAAASVLNAIYDIGSVQVLRGPQGTERGRTAPSGAILFSTRKASPTDWSGYVSMLGSEKGSINAQAAINVPLIDGILGMRVAGLVDENKFDFVTSAASGVDPYRKTKSGRVSLEFTPTDTLTADIEYQYLKYDSRQWTQVEGSGSAGGVTALAPANYNGPVIKGSDRLAAADFPRDYNSRTHQITASVHWDVLGQELSYVGGYLNDANTTHGDLDYGNQILGNGFYSNLKGSSRLWSHELRLSSPDNRQFFNYSVGFFHSLSNTLTDGEQPAQALTGSYGDPTSPDPSLLIGKYVLPTYIYAGGENEENSFYGNVRLRIGNRLELSGGLRYIMNRIDQVTQVTVGAGTIAVPLSIPCSYAGLESSGYDGYCDYPIAAATTPALYATREGTDHPLVYKASASYRVTDDILTYVSTGTSWRRGGINTGIVNSDNDPLLASFAFTPNETSTSYEAGIKTTFLDGRMRFNFAAFYQKYKNFVFQVLSIPYVSTDGTEATVVSNGIVVGADAIVKGFDADFNFQVTPSWSLGAAMSYADGKVDNDLVPCRDSNFDGVPDSGSPTLAQFQAAGVYVAECRTNQSVSTDPKWNANIQSEYHTSLGKSVEGYVRVLMNYYPKNPRANVGYTAPNYALVNLYTGIRDQDGRWDIGLFARNLTNATIRLSRDPSLITSSFDKVFGSSGYRFVRYTMPREVGLTVRYRFGDR